MIRCDSCRCWRWLSNHDLVHPPRSLAHLLEGPNVGYFNHVVNMLSSMCLVMPLQLGLLALALCLLQSISPGGLWRDKECCGPEV